MDKQEKELLIEFIDDYEYESCNRMRTSESRKQYALLAKWLKEYKELKEREDN